MKDNKGHDPIMVGTVQKWDRCRTCGAVKRRGERWRVKCAPKPRPERCMGQ